MVNTRCIYYSAQDRSEPESSMPSSTRRIIKNTRLNMLVTPVGLLVNAQQAEDIVQYIARGANGLDVV